MDNISFLIEPSISPIIDLDGYWASNTLITEGIDAYYFTLGMTSFKIGSDNYLIVTTFGVPYGFKWINNEWVLTQSIIAGLPSYTSSTAPKPTTYYIGTDLYLIYGMLNNGFKGYKWSGSTWVYDVNITSGLSTTTDSNKPRAFYIDSDLYLINGLADGTFDGYKHNGTSWDENTSILTGLPDVGAHAAPAIFNIGNTLCFLCGRFNGDFVGLIWNGSTWSSNSSLISGLTDIGMYSFPTIINIGTDIYLFARNNQALDMFGYKWTLN